MSFKKGDILEGRETVHPIVFLKKINEYKFSGCMLTHMQPQDGYDNIVLKTEHFEKNDSAGQLYKFQYDRTHFVKARLVKEAQWGPYEKIGKMTTEGIEYLENHLEGEEPTTWRFYVGEEENVDV